MLMSQWSLQLVAIMALAVFTVAYCQENERRAVTEHQLMHDRGRTIQSLKRLIWLSSAIEGLHTAQTRTAVNDIGSNWRSRGPLQLLSQAYEDSSSPKGAMETFLSDFYRPHFSAGLPGGKK
ncbi:parathyroid hormone 4 [Chanos chanos]|uniref:Parathyroid hormone 4 n=1 Tax=Chanos chanos TaxID=29144 RepID=A0A6J2VSL5_CHACN|nr:parathyroid hormone 4-like [Chanos chanos]